MKNIFFFFSLVLFALQTKAQPPEMDAKPGMVFGKEFNAGEAMDVNMMPSILVNDQLRPVTVSGTVTSVCKAAGCWMKLATENGGTMMVKMKDHSFAVPVSLEGKKIALTGFGKLEETSVEMLQHYAEDAGKSKKEIAAIKEPKQEIILLAEGVLVQ